jgi:glutamine synthetase
VTTLDEVRQRMAAAGASRVDLHVADLVGRWHRFSMPDARLTEASVAAGFGFDGSRLRGLQPVEASDMLLRPDLSTAVIDPVQAPPTLSIICDIADPATGQPSPRSPRAIASRAEEYLRASGIADTANFGAELEFFVFDEVRYQQLTNTGFYYVDSAEAHWNTGRDEQPNRGGKIPAQAGYAPTAPFDRLGPLRWAIADALTATGQEVEVHHHEVASGGQCELATRFDSLARKADQVQWYPLHRPEHGAPARAGGDVHAEAAGGCERLRDAHPPVTVEGRDAALP